GVRLIYNSRRQCRQGRLLKSSWFPFNAQEKESSRNIKDLLQLPDVVAGGELLKRFVAPPVPEVGAQHSLQGFRQPFPRYAAENLPADGLVFPETAADEDVIGIHAFAGDFCLGAEAADVSHVMLRAGVGATGE